MTVLRSTLLQGSGFEHGFGTRRTAPAEYPEDIHILLQVHGERVVALSEKSEIRNQKSDSNKQNYDFQIQRLPANPFRFEEGDAMVTDIPGTAVGIRTADCLPILVGDPATGAVAAIHCGWRSLATGLAGKGIKALLTLTGSKPDGLVAALGPSLDPSCYEVGVEVRDSFPSHNSEGLFEERGQSLFLDLAAGVKTQLLAEGMTPDAVEEIVGCCTRKS